MKTALNNLAEKITGLLKAALPGTAAWLILNETLAPMHILLGTGLSLLSLLLIEKTFGMNYLEIASRFRVRTALRYILYLPGRIYASSLQVLVRIVTGRTRTGVVEIKTILRDETSAAVLANSITLTPGTIVLDKRGQTLTVLCIDRPTGNRSKAGALIKQQYETILSGR